MKKRMMAWVIGVGVCISAFSYCAGRTSDSVDSKTTKMDKRPKYVVSGQDSKMRAFEKTMKEIGPAWDVLNDANRSRRAKNYDVALAKANYALTLPQCDQWVAHSIIQEVHEARGEYSLALNEVKWKIAQHLPNQPPQALLDKKVSLEKLLAEKNSK